MLACSSEETQSDWLKSKYAQLMPYRQYFAVDFGSWTTTNDEFHNHLVSAMSILISKTCRSLLILYFSLQIKQKLRQFRSKFDELQYEYKTLKKEENPEETKQETEKKDGIPQADDTSDRKYNSKKLRRKAKAFKAKIDKIRRADILERANYGKTVPEPCKEDENHDYVEKVVTETKDSEVHVIETNENLYCGQNIVADHSTGMALLKCCSSRINTPRDIEETVLPKACDDPKVFTGTDLNSEGIYIMFHSFFFSYIAS